MTCSKKGKKTGERLRRSRAQKFHRIMLNQRITAGEVQIGRKRLANEYSVERVAMMHGQTDQPGNGGFIQVQRLDAMLLALKRNVALGESGRGSFPSECFTHISQYETTLKKTPLAGFCTVSATNLGRRRITADKPEELAGVEQYGHLPSKLRSTPSGKGALKSFGTVNSPRARPIGRGAVIVGGVKKVKRPEIFSGNFCASFGTI